MKKCLLISPLSFYDWHNSISKELELRGYDVELMNDEYPEGALGLLMGNYLNSVTRSKTLKVYREFLSEKKEDYDLVLIFKGRGMSPELIELLSSRTKKIVAYNFDSFKYFPHALKWYSKVKNYKTFDYEDSQKYNISRVELFSNAKLTAPQEKTVDFSFVVKNHSERLKYLDEIYSELGDKYKFYILIFEKNIFTYIRSLLKHPFLVYKWRKYISFNSLSSEDYFKTLASSTFTLDYAHPSQSGVTMRCFQASACGTKLISNNPNLSNCDVVDDNNYYVHRLGGDTNRLAGYVKDNLTSEVVTNYRGVGEFLEELIAD